MLACIYFYKTFYKHICSHQIVPLHDVTVEIMYHLQLFSIFKLFTLFFRSHYTDTDIVDFEPPKRYHVASVLGALMHGSYS